MKAQARRLGRPACPACCSMSSVDSSRPRNMRSWSPSAPFWIAAAAVLAVDDAAELAQVRAHRALKYTQARWHSCSARPKRRAFFALFDDENALTSGTGASSCVRKTCRGRQSASRESHSASHDNSRCVAAA